MAAGGRCFPSSLLSSVSPAFSPVNARIPKNGALRTTAALPPPDHQNARMQNVTRTIDVARLHAPVTSSSSHAKPRLRNPSLPPPRPLSRTRTAKSRKRTPSPRGLTTRGSDPSTRGSRIAGGRSTPPSQTCRRWRRSSSWLAPRVSSRRWNPLTPFITPCRCDLLARVARGIIDLGCPSYGVSRRLVDVTKMGVSLANVCYVSPLSLCVFCVQVCAFH